MTTNMVKPSQKKPTDPDVKKQVKMFCNYVLWLKRLHQTIQILFENPDSSKLMNATASSFFLMMNEVLIDYFLLEVSKITDPSTAPRGANERFSVDNLVKGVSWSQEGLRKIHKLRKTTQKLRKRIKGARNNSLAHLDKSTVMSEETLGHFPEGEDVVFMDSLENLCNIFHKESFGGIVGVMVPSSSGDVLDLLKVMENGLAFNKLFKEAEGEDFRKLHEALEAVKKKLNDM